MKVVFGFVIILLLGSCNTAQKIKEHQFQRQYFPSELHSLYFGMPLQQVEKIRPAMAIEDSTSDSWIIYKERIGRDNLSEIIYYFDKKERQILYGFVIRFETLTFRQKEIRWRFGKPNHEATEWKKDSKEGFMIHIWTDETFLYLFGEMEGSKNPKSK